MININGKDKHLRDNTSDDVSTSPEKKNIIILGGNIIKNVNGYKISKKLKICGVFVKRFSGSKLNS